MDPALVRRSTLWLAALALASAAAAPPEIGYVTDGAKNYSPVVVFGEGFDAPKVQFFTFSPGRDLKPADMIARVGQPPFQPPATPPASQRPMHVLSLHPQVAVVVLYGGGYPGGTKAPQILWARNAEGCSKPYVANRPRLFFLERATAAPGDQLRVFGRNMTTHSSSHPAALFLRDTQTGKAHAVTWGKYFDRQNHFNYQLDFEIAFEVPADLPAARYELWVHCGASGWLGWCPKPLELEVAPRPQAKPQVFRITDFGATGDGIADDTQAIRKAIDAAKAAGGGIVLVPQGVFAIRSPLLVPEGVHLKGIRWQLSSIRVVAGLPFGGQFLDQDWSGYARDYLPHVRRLKPLPMAYVCSGSTVSDLELIGGQGTAYNLMSFAKSGEFHDFTVTRCRLVNPGSPLFTTGGGFQPGRSCFGGGNPWRRVRVTHNILRAMAGCGTWGEQTECVVAHNDFEPAGGPFGTTGFTTLSGWHNIVEGNVVRNSNRGFTAGPWSQKLQGENFIARNRVAEGGRNQGAAESYLIEYGAGGHDGWLGRVAAAGADWFEGAIGAAGRNFAKPPLPTDAFTADPPPDARAALTPGAHEGTFAIVFKGTGLGQYRRVVKNTGSRFLLDRPWRIRPDHSSWIVVRRMYYSSIFLNNVARDTLGSLEFWGGMLENVVCRHMAFRTAPLHLMTHGEPIVIHNRFDGCQLYGSSLALWNLHHYDTHYHAPTLVGNVFTGNQLEGGSILLLRRAYGRRGYIPLDDPEVAADGPSMAWNVFAANRILPQAGRYAIHLVDPSCTGTVFWRNAFPADRILDKGSATVWADNSDAMIFHVKDAYNYDIRAYQRGEAR